MGNLISGVGTYFDVWVWNTPQQIDFEFSQMKMMNEAQAAGRQELLAQLANTGTLASAGGGGGLAGAAPWGYAPAFWIGVSNFFALAALIMVPGAIAMAIVVHLTRFGSVYAWLAYFLLFFFLAEIILYYSSVGHRLISTDRNHIYSLLFGLILSTILTFVTY